MRKITLILTISLWVNGVFAQKISSYDFSVVREWVNATEKLYYGFALNKGQINEEALLYSKGPGFNIYISERGLSFTIFSFERDDKNKENSQISKIDDKLIKGNIKKGNIKVWRIDYDLIGGNIKKENIVFEDEIENYYENYYTQYAPDGILFVRLYKKVRIKEVYPGIDWILRYDENGNFHHEFEASPNSNIAQIKIKVKNAQIELIDEGRSVLLKTPIGIIKDGNLIAYEGKKEISAKYTIKDNLLSFEIKNYEGKEKLLIDPHALVWATYYGGNNDDGAFSISTDANGNVFVVGSTSSTDFPRYNPGGGAYFDGTCGTDGNCNYDYDNYYSDVFILKFNNNGIRLWATYYGGSRSDVASSISTDANGNVFVVGYTLSTNFPRYNPGGGAYYQGTCGGCTTYSDAFILKFTNNGVRLWATYYGGNNDDVATSISTDANGNVFVVGYTSSTDFPTYNPGGGAYYQPNNAGGSDAFILKFTNNGVRLWATYYGGSNGDGASSISTDANGNVFVVGGTESTNFPTYNPGGGAYFDGTCGTDGNCNYNGYNYRSDAFILKFTNNGIRLWATYYGGSNWDEAYSISTDVNGNVFVVGGTFSTDFPTQDIGGGAYYQANNAGWSDVFILKFTNNGIRLWATYYGGGDSDVATSISTDANGNVFVVGWTWSNYFPTYNPGGGAYYQPNNASPWAYDAFILKFNNNGIRLWATYYGGNYGDVASSISTDANGNVFVVGWTYSTNFPTYNPGGGAYYQPNKVDYSDVFISKFSGSISIPESFISSIKIKNNNVIIKLNENINGEFKVFTILGREIIRGKINNNEISFKVPSSGIYILKVNNKNVKIVVK
jgi:predicted SpoU family rRNA methylase